MAAWRVVGWIAATLAFVGLADVLLVFYPWRFGQPAWEFGIMDAAVSSLPLVVVGFAGMLGSAFARRRPGQLITLGALAVLLGSIIFVGYVLYLTNVPIALRIAPAEVVTGIHKSIARVSIMSLAFGTMFIVGGIAAMRNHR